MAEPEKKTTAVKATQTVRKVRGLVKALYASAHEAKANGQPVAYCMVGCTYDEILKAAGVVPVYTENYAGVCAAKRQAEPFLLRAEADGYSNVLCSYARTGLGFDAIRQETGQIPPDAPDGGMADPDLLLGCSYACDPRFKWYQAVGHYREVPTWNIDVMAPPVDADLDEVRDYYIKYQVQQFHGLVDFLEQHTDRKMDWDRLTETLDMADETYRWWWDTYQLRKAVPSPMPSQDHFNAFVPGFFMLGTQAALDFYRELYAEVKQRMDNKISVIPQEKHRILWAGGLPPWHNMGIFNYFEDHGAVFVMETAYRPLEPVEVPKGVTHPLERIAWRSYLRSVYRYQRARENSGDPRVELLLEFLEDYQADGMVMHNLRSCRAATVGQIHFKNLVQKYVDVPTLFIESDMVDTREFSEADTKKNIDSFIELLGPPRRG